MKKTLKSALICALLAMLALCLMSVSASADVNFADMVVGDLYEDKSGLLYEITEKTTDSAGKVHFVCKVVLPIGSDGYSIPYSGKSYTIPHTFTAEGCAFTVYEISRYAFSECDNLESVTIQEGITKIGESAFQNCAKLTTITFPDSLEYIGDYAFEHCSYLSGALTFSDNLVYLGNYAFNNTAISEVTLPSSLTVINDHAFSYTLLKHITIGENVTNIEAAAFRYNNSLKSVTIPENVEYIGIGAFELCDNLETVTFAKSSKLKEIDSAAFYNCISLKSISIPASVIEIHSNAFSDCTSLTSVTFADNSEIKSINDSAFLRCSALKSITLPSSLVIVQPNVFDSCTSLETVIFDGNDTFSLMEQAFKGCTALKSITLPESLGEIEHNVFENCTALTSIVIPASVKRISSNVFQNCSALNSIVVMYDEQKTINEYAFDGNNATVTYKYANPTNLRWETDKIAKWDGLKTEHVEYKVTIFRTLSDGMTMRNEILTTPDDFYDFSDMIPANCVDYYFNVTATAPLLKTQNIFYPGDSDKLESPKIQYFPPVLTDVSVERTHEKTFSVKFNSDQDGLFYYKLYDPNLLPIDPFSPLGEGIAVTAGENTVECVTSGNSTPVLYVKVVNNHSQSSETVKLTIPDWTKGRVTYADPQGFATELPVDETDYNFGLFANILYPDFMNNYARTFLGWSTDPNATSPEFTEGGSARLTVNSNVTLYAVWKTPYSVTYDINSELEYTGTLPTDENLYKGNATVNVLFTELSIEGKHFAGWATHPASGDARYKPDGTTSFTITEDTTLYAIWLDIHQYKWYEDASAYGYKVIPHPMYNLPEGATEHDGYRDLPFYFKIEILPGWEKTEDFSVFSSPEGYTSAKAAAFHTEGEFAGYYSVTIAEHSVVIFVNGTGLKKIDYTVTYDVNTDKENTGTLPTDTHLYNYGDTVTVDLYYDNAPEVDGEPPLGWSTDSDAVLPEYSYIDWNSGKTENEYTIYDNTTFYAIWKRDFTVSFPSEYVICTPETGYTTTVRTLDSFKFKVALIDDYTASNGLEVYANGELLSAVDGVYTVEDITSDIEITVDGIDLPSAVAVELITVNGYQIEIFDENTTLRLDSVDQLPTSGEDFTIVTVDPNATVTTPVQIGERTWKFTVTSSDGSETAEYTINFTVDIKAVSVSYNAEYGTVTGAGEYEIGSTVVLTATPNDGYCAVGWKLNGEWVDAPLVYEFKMPDEPTMVEASFYEHLPYMSNLGDGTHILHCGMCDKSEGEAFAHVDSNGDMYCDECGADMSEKLGETYIGKSISLDGRIGMNLYLEIPTEVLADPDAYVEFMLPDGSNTRQLVSDAPTKDVNGVTTHIFTCSFAAAEMTDFVYAQLHSGEISGETHELIIESYANELLNSPDYGDSVKNLVRHLLNYGGYSQIVFDYYPDYRPNMNLDESFDLSNADEIDTELAAYEKNVSGSVTGITYDGSSALLRSGTALRHYFTLSEGELIDDYSFTLESSPDGSNIPLEIFENANGYYVEIDDIPAYYLDATYTVTVTKGAETLTIDYSVLSYCHELASSTSASITEDHVNIARAIYNYNRAAKEYFG